MDGQNCSSCAPFLKKLDDQNSEATETQHKVDELSEDFKEKLQTCRSGNNGHLNGCTKAIYDEGKNVDFVINGLIKYHNLDRVAHQCVEQLCACATSEANSNSIETKNSEASSNDVNQCHDSSSREPTVSSDVQNLVPQTSLCVSESDIVYIGYESERQMPDIMRLIQKDLSEPYSIYTYRYFIHNWPKLCFLAHHGERCVGAIVCKLDVHKKHSRRGYIAMLAVDEMYRKRKIGSNLVLKAIRAMVQDNADEVVLETEITNKSALRLYENLGFVRDKRLFRYYLNGVDALRLKLWLR